jgi:hypothetical protein
MWRSRTSPPLSTVLIAAADRVAQAVQDYMTGESAGQQEPSQPLPPRDCMAPGWLSVIFAMRTEAVDSRESFEGCLARTRDARSGTRLSKAAGTNRGHATTYVELDFLPYHLGNASTNPLRGPGCDETENWELVVQR